MAEKAKSYLESQKNVKLKKLLHGVIVLFLLACGMPAFLQCFYVLSSFTGIGNGGRGGYSKFKYWHLGYDKIPQNLIDENSLSLPYSEAYFELDYDRTAISKDAITVGIFFTDPKTIYTPSQLAATCASAAKFYAKSYEVQAVRIQLYENKEMSLEYPLSHYNSYGCLAECIYSPQGRGWEDTDQPEWTWLDKYIWANAWVWKDIKVREHMMSAQEHIVKDKLLKYQKMCKENRNMQKERPDYYELISKELCLDREEIRRLVAGEKFKLFPWEIFSSIESQKPVEQVKILSD